MNNDEIRNTLEDEILTELQKLDGITVGSKEHQTAVEDISKLYRIGLEESRADCDYDEKYHRREIDTEHEKNELSKQERDEQIRREQIAKQDRFQKISLAATTGLGLLELIVLVRAHRDDLRFEETGSFTSRSAQHVSGLRRLFKTNKK